MSLPNWALPPVSGADCPITHLSCADAAQAAAMSAIASAMFRGLIRVLLRTVLLQHGQGTRGHTGPHSVFRRDLAANQMLICENQKPAASPSRRESLAAT